jgi:hypothetical protein
LILATAPFLLAGCLRFNWGREWRHAPLERVSLAQLDAEDVDLSRCLELFGAPLWVWEDQGGQGVVLAYGWSREKVFGFNLSAPVTEYVSASFEYGKIDERMRGLVLFFDEDWKLRTWRTGLLRDLTRAARRPPADVELLEEG